MRFTPAKVAPDGATCPVCSRQRISLLKSGVLREHTRWPRYGARSVTCEGSRRRPDDEALRQRAPLLLAAKDAAELHAIKVARVEGARQAIVDAEATIAKVEPTLPMRREAADAAAAALAAHDAKAGAA